MSVLRHDRGRGMLSKKESGFDRTLAVLHVSAPLTVVEEAEVVPLGYDLDWDRPRPSGKAMSSRQSCCSGRPWGMPIADVHAKWSEARASYVEAELSPPPLNVRPIR